LIGERIGAGEVFHIVETEIRIDREHSSRTENVNIAWRDVYAVNNLTLILAQRLLIKLIRSLKVVTREKQIQVKRIFRVRTVVDAIKDATRRSLVMQHSEFGRVKETPRTLKIKGNKVSGLCIS